MKKRLVLLIALAITSQVLIGLSSANASNVSLDVTETAPGVGLGEESNVSYLQGMETTPDGQWNQIQCSSLSDTRCLAMDSWNIFSLLPACDSGNFEQCIVGLDIQDGSNYVSAQYLEEANSLAFAESSTLHTPAGSSASLWSYKGTDGQEKYFSVRAQVSYVAHGNQAPTPTSMNAYVFPVSITQDQGTPYSVTLVTQNGHTGVNGIGGPTNGQNCVYFSVSGKCGIDLNQLINVRLHLRVDNRLTGWLSGRLSQSAIEVSPFDNFTNNLNVSGRSVGVPQILKTISRNQLPPEMQNIGAGIGGVIPTSDISLMLMPNQGDGLGAYNTYKDLLGDQATSIDNAWSVRSLPASTNSCLSSTSSLEGIVATNSTFYSPKPPEYQDGELKYQLASLHLLPDGSTFQGSYDLNLSSAAAKCLYGLSGKQVQATISIVHSDGTSTVSTNILNLSPDWLHVNIQGFSFSNPQIELKLTDVSDPSESAIGTSTPTSSTSVVTDPAASAAPVTSGSTKITTQVKTLICQKGSVKKKVTAKQCPSGYKLAK